MRADETGGEKHGNDLKRRIGSSSSGARDRGTSRQGSERKRGGSRGTSRAMRKRRGVPSSELDGVPDRRAGYASPRSRRLQRGARRGLIISGNQRDRDKKRSVNLPGRHREPGTHQVGGDEDLGAVLDEVLDGGDGGADAGVVGDLEVLVEGHVEVAAHEHGLALEVSLLEVADGLLLGLNLERGASLGADGGLLGPHGGLGEERAGGEGGGSGESGHRRRFRSGGGEVVRINVRVWPGTGVGKEARVRKPRVACDLSPRQP